MVYWANQNKITLMYIQLGKPTPNAYADRFNRTVRHEWLDLHGFETVEHGLHPAICHWTAVRCKAVYRKGSQCNRCTSSNEPKDLLFHKQYTVFTVLSHKFKPIV
jgi:putative transposase